jgi:SAM-dependent methyltransferase
MNSSEPSAGAARSWIDWTKKPNRDIRCPVCGADGSKSFVLTSAASWHEGPSLDLFACPSCDSRFFVDFEPPKYEHFDSFDAYLKFYLEVGAGVDQLVRHVFAAPLNPNAHYLEIGCGFGFALDFARRMLALDVCGIDPSPFAAAGARLLGLPIIGGYLTQDTDLGGRKFDLAVASEVIEHIAEPVAFLRLIAAHLAPNGVLILTTPNGESAAPSTPAGMLRPLLSTGWHYILFSRKSLASVLELAGFRHVEVLVRNHTLVAAATSGDLRVDLEAPVDRGMLRRYLEERRHSVDDNRISHGLGYRLLKELTNDSRYEEALAVYEDLKSQFAAAYGLDIEAPPDQWLRPEDRADFHAFALRYPMCLCGVAYLRGIMALNHHSNPAQAVHFFSLAAQYGRLLREALQAVGADDGETEQLTQRSRILVNRALAYTAPEEAAAGALNLLVENPPQRDAVSEIFVHLVNLGALNAAGRLAHAAPEEAAAGALNLLAENPHERDAVLRIFVHLVNLGALKAAGRLAHEAESGLIEMRTTKRGSDKLGIELHRALGLLEINERRRPRRAAAHFALAERIASRARESDPDWTWTQICQARHDRLLAWVVAGNASRALKVGGFFGAVDAPRPIPVELAQSAEKLVAQAAASIAMVP